MHEIWTLFCSKIFKQFVTNRGSYSFFLFDDQIFILFYNVKKINGLSQESMVIHCPSTL